MAVEYAERPPNVGDLLRNLLDISTLPHLLLLAIVSSVGYIVSLDGDGLAFVVAAFVSFTIGYALTGWMQEMDVVVRFSHVQPAPEGASLGDRIAYYPLRVISSWLAPIAFSAIPFTLIAWFLTTIGKEQIEGAALVLAGLFVVWSWMQGRAMANSLRIPIEARAARMVVTEREARLTASSTTHIGLTAGFGALCYWILVIGIQQEEPMGLVDIIKLAGFGLLIGLIQYGLLHRTAERRQIDASRNDTATFGFTWGLLVQLFVTWHLLSAIRRFTGGGWGIGVIAEELTLMLLTVVAAIWSLAKDSHDRGLRIFTRENAIFWGLSFGIGYAGSIAMIAILATRLTGGFFDYGLAGAVGIGHLITAATMFLTHWVRIGSIADWLDDARTESDPDPVSEEPEEEAEPDEEEEEEEEIELVDLDLPPPVTADDDDQ